MWGLLLDALTYFINRKILRVGSEKLSKFHFFLKVLRCKELEPNFLKSHHFDFMIEKSINLDYVRNVLYIFVGLHQHSFYGFELLVFIVVLNELGEWDVFLDKLAELFIVQWKFWTIIALKKIFGEGEVNLLRIIIRIVS